MTHLRLASAPVTEVIDQVATETVDVSVPDARAEQLRQMLKVGGYVRMTFGLAMMLAPNRMASGWVGAEGRRAGFRPIMRALGVRDLLIGALAVQAAKEQRLMRRAVEFAMVSDGVDFLATLVSAGRIRKRNAAMILAISGSSAAAGAYSLSQLPEGA